jgi:Putative transposase
MTLDANEFIRRFLLHALPDGFRRIRHYGFLANGGRSDSLAFCRQLLDTRNASATSKSAPDHSKAVCPECGGTLRRTATVPPACFPSQPFYCDTS